MADQVEAALEELYSLDPGEFTKRRDAVVKQLKAVGDKDGAAVIAARKKPTQMAWVLNQLARQEPDAIADLVDVGRELAREQRRALRGEASHGLRESIDRQRKAISEAGKKAVAVMHELGVDAAAHLQEVTMALQAALVDPTVGAALEEGRLEKAPEAAVGFGGPMAPAPVESEPAPSKKKSEPPRKAKSEPPPRDELAERRKKKSDSEAERKREEAERKREEAEREKAAERKRAHAAHAKSVAEANAILRAAEQEAGEARAAAESAATEAEAAELVAKKAREAAEAASANAKRLAAEISRAERTVAAAKKELTRLEANAPD